MDLKGLKGYHSQSVNQLIAAYGNDFVNVLTGSGFGVNISSDNDVEFDNFLGSLFFQNYIDTPRTYNGSVWSTQHVKRLPLSKYIRNYDSRQYLAFIKIRDAEYPSRVWYSDLPINDTIQWGFEHGSNLATVAGSNVVHSNNAGFKTYNIKRGDPFFIISGNDSGQYSVKSVDSDQQITLADYNGNDITLTTTASSITYWVGGNYFDVQRDDGDYITWIEHNFSQLIIFKRESLHRFEGSRLTQIKDAPGTTNGRSVINLRDWTIYFFGGQGDETGFYAYDSSDAYKISNGIQKYIDGINLSTPPIAWKEGQLYRCYVGNIVNTVHNINIPNAVMTYDYLTKAWSIDPIASEIQAATEFRQGNVITTFIGKDAEIFETPSGSTFNGEPIPFSFDIGNIYPKGTHTLNTFTRLQVISEYAQGIKVLYKRRLTPYNSDPDFTPLGDLRSEATWFKFNEAKNQSAGIDLRFQSMGTTDPRSVIKKIVLFYVGGSSIIE